MSSAQQSSVPQPVSFYQQPVAQPLAQPIYTSQYQPQVQYQQMQPTFAFEQPQRLQDRLDRPSMQQSSMQQPNVQQQKSPFFNPAPPPPPPPQGSSADGRYVPKRMNVRTLGAKAVKCDDSTKIWQASSHSCVDFALRSVPEEPVESIESTESTSNSTLAQSR